MSFQPFQKVLVRTGTEPWRPAFYGYGIDESHHVTTGGQIVAEVRPYEGNESISDQRPAFESYSPFQQNGGTHRASTHLAGGNYDPPEGSEIADVVKSEFNPDRTVGNPGWRGFQIILTCKRGNGEQVRAWETLDIEGRKSNSLQQKAKKVWRALTGSDCPATLPAAAALMPEIRIPKQAWIRPKELNGKTYWNVTKWGA